MASSSHDHQYPDGLTASAREQGPDRRVDRAHRIVRDRDEAQVNITAGVTSASDAATSDSATHDTAPVDDPVAALLGEGPHVHLQAEQLARLLADRLAEIDRRESQLHLLAADLDNQQRTARLSLVERERELDRREEFLTRLEASADHVDESRAHDRLDRFVRADTKGNSEPIHVADDDESTPSSFDVAEEGLEAVLDARQQRLDAIRDTLVEEHRRLVDSRRTLEVWARRQRDEIERQAAELAQRSRSVELQAVENERWRVERVKCYEELQRLRRSQRRTVKSA